MGGLENNSMLSLTRYMINRLGFLFISLISFIIYLTISYLFINNKMGAGLGYLLAPWGIFGGYLAYIFGKKYCEKFGNLGYGKFLIDTFVFWLVYFIPIIFLIYFKINSYVENVGNKSQTLVIFWGIISLIILFYLLVFASYGFKKAFKK